MTKNKVDFLLNELQLIAQNDCLLVILGEEKPQEGCDCGACMARDALKDYEKTFSPTVDPDCHPTICPTCHRSPLYVVRYTLEATGETVDDWSLLTKEGFVTLNAPETLEDCRTTDELVECTKCGEIHKLADLFKNPAAYPKDPENVCPQCGASDQLITSETGEIECSSCGYELITEDAEDKDDEELKRVFIGEVGVDSGQLMIVDPCYLHNWEPGDFNPKNPHPSNSYDEVCRVTAATKEYYGQTFRGLAAAFASGYGDGVYPVYGYLDENGRVMKVEILMG